MICKASNKESNKTSNRVSNRHLKIQIFQHCLPLSKKNFLTRLTFVFFTFFCALHFRAVKYEYSLRFVYSILTPRFFYFISTVKKSQSIAFAGYYLYYKKSKRDACPFTFPLPHLWIRVFSFVRSETDDYKCLRSLLRHDAPIALKAILNPLSSTPY